MSVANSSDRMDDTQPLFRQKARFLLQSERLEPLPLINHFIQRIGLEVRSLQWHGFVGEGQKDRIFVISSQLDRADVRFRQQGHPRYPFRNSFYKCPNIGGISRKAGQP